MIGRKTVLAATAAMAALGFTVPAAHAATADTVTLVRADGSTETVPWQKAKDGTRFATDPRAKAKSTASPQDGPVIYTAPAGSFCWRYEVCLYEHAGQGGWQLHARTGYGVANLNVIPCDCQTSSKHPDSNGTFNDQMSSWANYTGQTYCWSFNDNLGGDRHVMVDNVIVNVTPFENDEATSLYPTNC